MEGMKSAPAQEQIVRCPHCGGTIRTVMFADQPALPAPAGRSGVVRQPVAMRRRSAPKMKPWQEAAFSGAYRFFARIGKLL